MIKIFNCNLGSDAKYAVQNAPGYTKLENCSLATPVQSTSSPIVLDNCAYTPLGVVTQ
jgi:hypothetical protein